MEVLANSSPRRPVNWGRGGAALASSELPLVPSVVHDSIVNCDGNHEDDDDDDENEEDDNDDDDHENEEEDDEGGADDGDEPHFHLDTRKRNSGPSDDNITRRSKRPKTWAEIHQKMKDEGWTHIKGKGLVDCVYLHPTCKGVRFADLRRENVEGVHYFTSTAALRDHAMKNCGLQSDARNETDDESDVYDNDNEDDDKNDD